MKVPNAADLRHIEMEGELVLVDHECAPPYAIAIDKNGDRRYLERFILLAYGAPEPDDEVNLGEVKITIEWM